MKIRFVPGFLLSFILTLLIASAQAQEAKIKVTGIKFDSGTIVLIVFKDSEGFENSEPYKILTFKKKEMINGVLTLKVRLSIDTFGILLLDDKNNNQRMDMNARRIPLEGFGFSNYYMHKAKRPIFNDFKAHITFTNNTVVINVKYP